MERLRESVMERIEEIKDSEAAMPPGWYPTTSASRDVQSPPRCASFTSASA